MVEIVWTQVALNDLKDIFDFIAKDSKRYSTITTQQIVTKSKSLSPNPLIGRIVPEFNINSLRELIEGNYRIVYKIVSDQQVDVLRIHHSARLFRSESLI